MRRLLLTLVPVLGTLAVLAAGFLANRARQTPPNAPADRHSSAGPPAAPPGEVAFRGGGWDVFDAYAANVAAADARFLGRAVEVSFAGTARKDRDGRYYFAGAVESRLGQEPNPIPNLVVYVRPDQAGRLASVKPDATPTFRARVRGRQDRRAAWQGFFVVFEDGEVLDPG